MKKIIFLLAFLFLANCSNKQGQSTLQQEWPSFFAKDYIKVDSTKWKRESIPARPITLSLPDTKQIRIGYDIRSIDIYVPIKNAASEWVTFGLFIDYPCSMSPGCSQAIVSGIKDSHTEDENHRLVSSVTDEKQNIKEHWVIRKDNKRRHFFFFVTKNHTTGMQLFPDDPTNEMVSTAWEIVQSAQVRDLDEGSSNAEFNELANEIRQNPPDLPESWHYIDFKEMNISIPFPYAEAIKVNQNTENPGVRFKKKFGENFAFNVDASLMYFYNFKIVDDSAHRINWSPGSMDALVTIAKISKEPTSVDFCASSQFIYKKKVHGTTFTQCKNFIVATNSEYVVLVEIENESLSPFFDTIVQNMKFGDTNISNKKSQNIKDFQQSTNYNLPNMPTGLWDDLQFAADQSTPAILSRNQKVKLKELLRDRISSYSFTFTFEQTENEIRALPDGSYLVIGEVPDYLAPVWVLHIDKEGNLIKELHSYSGRPEFLGFADGYAFIKGSFGDGGGYREEVNAINISNGSAVTLKQMESFQADVIEIKKDFFPKQCKGNTNFSDDISLVIKKIIDEQNVIPSDIVIGKYCLTNKLRIVPFAIPNKNTYGVVMETENGTTPIMNYTHVGSQISPPVFVDLANKGLSLANTFIEKKPDGSYHYEQRLFVVFDDRNLEEGSIDIVENPDFCKKHACILEKSK
jgi:hypothetical protein